MAKTPKEREHPAPAPSAPRSPERIAVTNMCRHRPILFHFRGGSARLGPLETQELDQASLASPELAQLVASGMVHVIDVAPAEGVQVERRKPADGGTEG